MLAALGLILPATFGVVPILTPLAAAGLVIVMIGAAVTHGRRGEHPAIAVNVVLLVLAAFVAWGRFGPPMPSDVTARPGIHGCAVETRSTRSGWKTT
ncbi:DoxX family protein [Nonomuraea ferruginea]